MNGQIALVNVKSDLRVHPLSLLCVGSALKRAGFNVKIYNISHDGIEAGVKEIIGLKPLFVGVSLFTGIHTAIAVKISLKLKEYSSSTLIVWGGIHPTLIPRQCLAENFVDIVVHGEGEETAVELARALTKNSDLREIKGIGFKSKGTIFLNQPRPLLENLDNYKLDWSLINIDECLDTLTDGTRYMDYMTSRGCPFNCGFCYNLAFNQRRWRAHTFEHVIKEVMHLKEISGINGIFFADDNFMVDIPRAFKILSFLRENGIKCVKFEMRLDSVNEKNLRILNGLGVKNIFVGWESGSNRILKLINKGITREEIIDKFKLFSRFPDISVSAAAIIGFPTETWEETCQTIDLGLKISELVAGNVTTFQTFLPYPGTALYPLAIKDGFIPPKRSVDWEGYNAFYGTMKLEWLPWAKKNTPKIFYRIDKYGKLLNHAKGDTFLRTLGKKICYFLARIRLKYRVFIFPVEIYILHRFNRYYLGPKGRIIKR